MAAPGMAEKVAAAGKVVHPSDQNARLVDLAMVAGDARADYSGVIWPRGFHSFWGTLIMSEDKMVTDASVVLARRFAIISTILPIV